MVRVTRRMRFVALIAAWAVAVAALLCLAWPGTIADIRIAALDELEVVLWREPTTPTIANLAPPPTVLVAAAHEKR